MTNWTLGKSDNYEAEQDERVAVFDRIKTPGDWKLPIDAVIYAEDFEEANNASIWFAGCELTVAERLPDNKLRVTAPGYYATIDPGPEV